MPPVRHPIKRDKRCLSENEDCGCVRSWRRVEFDRRLMTGSRCSRYFWPTIVICAGANSPLYDCRPHSFGERSAIYTSTRASYSFPARLRPHHPTCAARVDARSAGDVVGDAGNRVDALLADGLWELPVWATRRRRPSAGSSTCLRSDQQET